MVCRVAVGMQSVIFTSRHRGWTSGVPYAGAVPHLLQQLVSGQSVHRSMRRVHLRILCVPAEPCAMQGW